MLVSLPLSVCSQTAKSLNVFVFGSAAQGNNLQTTANALGHNVVRHFNDNISGVDLSSYDVVMFAGLNTLNTATEANVRNFISSGGRVFLQGENVGFNPTINASINRILQPILSDPAADFAGNTNGTNSTFTSGPPDFISSSTILTVPNNLIGTTLPTTGHSRMIGPPSGGSVILKDVSDAAIGVYLSGIDGDFISSSAGEAMVIMDINFLNNLAQIQNLFENFLYVPPVPGGVNANLALWLKADAGVTGTTAVTQWDDQTYHAHNGTSTTGPELVNEVINFNPALSFDDLNFENIDLSAHASSIISKNNSVYIVAQGTGVDQDVFFSTHDSGQPINTYNTNSIVGGISAFEFFMSYTNSGTTYAGYQDGTVANHTEMTIGSADLLPDINTATFVSGGNFDLAVNGSSLSSVAAAADLHVGDYLNIGSHGGANNFLDRYFDGNIAEVIVYDVENTSAGTSRNQIDSYLALKYGITLDQSVAQDYLSSNSSTKMWDKDTTEAATFNNDIFGVGRDECSALGQIKSKSINPDAILTILAEGESSDDSNTPANYSFVDLDDMEFLTISNNDQNATGNTWTATGSPLAFQILTRQWSVQEVGDVGTLQLDFDLADADFDIPDAIGTSDYYLIYDSNNDGDLSDESPTLMTDQGSEIWRATGINLSDGMEFTLAAGGYDVSDALLSYGNAQHVASTDLYIGTAPDVDASTINTANADGDDLSGDDEDSVIFQNYNHKGGMVCTGVNGSYTTNPQEYCVVVNVTNTRGSPAQLVGWLDYSDDDVFQTGERSLADLGGNGTGVLVGNSSGGAGDASYTSGNILNGFSGDVVLVFTGLDVGIDQSRNETVMRLRITDDTGSDFFTSPSPSSTVNGGEVEDHLLATGTLPVQFNSFVSKIQGNRIKFSWNTASELFNVGFQLWGLDEEESSRTDQRSKTGKWKLLHPRLIVSNSGNAAEPQNYSRSLNFPRYFNLNISQLKAVGISSVDNDGTEHYYGPFTIGKRYGGKVNLKPIDWSKVRNRSNERMKALGYEKFKNGFRLTPEAGLKENTIQAEALADEQSLQTVVELEIDQDGLYRLTGAELVQAGVAIEEFTRANTTLLNSMGNPVSAIIRARGKGRGVHRTLGERGEIVFYGQGVKGEAALYSKRSIYRIKIDEKNVRRAAFQRKQRLNGDFSEYYRETVLLEEQDRYAVMNQGDDPWIMDKMVFAKRPRTVLKTVNLPADVLEDKGYQLILGLGRESSLKTVDVDGDGIKDTEHVVQGTVVDAQGQTHVFERRGAVGKGAWILRLAVPEGLLLKDSQNQAQIGAVFSTGAGYRFSLATVDHVGLNYARRYKAKTGQAYLNFKTPADQPTGYEVILPMDGLEKTGVNINRFISVYAIKGEELTRIIPESVQWDGESQVQVQFAALKTTNQDSPPIEYWVAARTGYLSVNSIRNTRIQTPESMMASIMGSSFLIIAHPAFMGENTDGFDALQTYVGFKQNQDINTAIVNYLDVVSVFGGGQPGPFGLQRYLRQAGKLGNLNNVLLVGGGSYDHLNYLNVGARTFLPPFYRATGFAKFATTDAPYVEDINNDRENVTQAMNIGRWPVREIDELEFLVNKSMNFANRNNQFNKALLIAENTDGLYDFKSELEFLRRKISPPIAIKSLYLDDILEANEGKDKAISYGQAKKTFIELAHDKMDAIIYLGHGSVDRLMKANVFNATDVKHLKNAEPSIWLSLACYVVYYESLHVNTMAHRLLFSGNAVNIAGPMYLSGLGNNMNFADHLLDNLIFGQTMGAAMRTTKHQIANKKQTRNWNLLGDPTLKFMK